MLVRWARRAVGDRFGPVRLLPLLVCVGYLLLAEPVTPGWADWAVVLAAAALFLAGGAWPLGVALGESALIVVAHLASAPGLSAVTVLASVSLFELAIRRPLSRAVVAALALSGAYFAVLDYEATVAGILGVGHELTVGAAAPLLLGALLRSAAQAVTQARARAEERRESAVRDARQAERTEIARELHDLVAHHVASISLRVGIARAVVPDLDPRVAAVLDDVHGSAKTTLADLRRLLGVLRDPSARTDGTRSVLVDPAELPAAVTAVTDRGAHDGIEMESHVDPAIATLDSVRGLAVLRLVQEGLTNVAKHAGGGARVTVRVGIGDGHARVEVTDDGGTPNRQAHLVTGGPGYGLVGLRERVAMVGGTLTAGPHGDGWRLHATLPVAADPTDTPDPRWSSHDPNPAR